MAEQQGLRERKKQETWRSIAETARRLFKERSFDAVTVDDIAREAHVSRKTVFNYFPTKEDLFFDEVPARQAAIVAALRGRAPGESVVAALRRLQAGECPRLCSPGFATSASRRRPGTRRSTGAWSSSPWSRSDS